MTFGSTSRTQLRYTVETTPGTTPTTGNSYNLRMTGESLDFALTLTGDKEIRPDRQQTSATVTDAKAAGDVKVHFQYAEYDRWFAGLLQNAWSAYGTNGVGTTFTATVTAGVLGVTASTITAAVAPTGTSAFTDLQPGQWFQFQAVGDPNNGKLFRVSTTVPASATVLTLDVNTPAVASTDSDAAISSSRLTNGTTMVSYSLEKNFEDIGQFLIYRGMNVSKFTTTFSSASLTEATFSFMGMNSNIGTATELPGAPIASQTYAIQNAVTGVGNVWENGAPIVGTAIKSLSLNVDNSLRDQMAIGTLGAAGIASGTLQVKGSLEVYFANETIYNQYLNSTYTSLSVSSQDALGNGYVITMPHTILTTGKVAAGAINQDLIATFDYEAKADLGNANPLLQQTIFIDRVGAAVVP
jgi:hypothetical protein